MTARQTLPKDQASEDRAEFERASREIDSMDGVLMASASVAPPVRVPAGGGGKGMTRDDAARHRGMTRDQFEDHVVESDSWFHRPIKGTEGRKKSDAEYAERQRLNKLKASGGPR